MKTALEEDADRCGIEEQLKERGSTGLSIVIGQLR